jgi:cytochrome c5
VSSQRRLSLVVAGVLSLAAALGAQAQTAQEKEIAERIKPVGEVCIQGKSDCAAPVAAVASGPRSGDQVYGTACLACHDTGAAGAPKKGVAADWATRIAQGEDTLVSNAINGIRGMPPRGTCMTCSDDEIRAAVQFIVAQSQ